MYERMLHVINKEKMPRLDAKGPLSLNYVTRKDEMKRIGKGNNEMQQRMDQAKSEYSMYGPVGRHMQNFDRNKKLLRDSSSIDRFDPLVQLELRKQNVDISSFKSARRSSVQA